MKRFEHLVLDYSEHAKQRREPAWWGTQLSDGTRLESIGAILAYFEQQGYELVCMQPDYGIPALEKGPNMGGFVVKRYTIVLKRPV